jgi:hypothetical protein
MTAAPVLFIIIALQGAAITAPEEAPVEQAAAPVFSLLDRIAAAKAALSKVVIGTDRVGSENAVLAVSDGPGLDQITLVRVRRGVSQTHGYTVECVHYNGVNSDYRVTDPPDRVVLAAKFNVGARHGRRGRGAVIYTPYTPALHTPEMVAAGRAYLDGLLAKAAADLDARGVASRSVAGRRVTETVDARILAAILVVEHFRSDKIDELGLRHVIEEVLVVLGANGGDAYDHAVSSARAQGLAQFITGSYRLTRSRYPAAKLAADFNAGMADHLNAVKAEYCLADWTLTALRPEELADLQLPGFEEDLGAYVAAAYNGGERRAAAIYGRYSQDWEKPGYGLWRETVSYVRFFRAVYRQLYPETMASEPESQTFDP